MPAAFVILASLEKPSIRSFADLESATAARKGEAIVVETAEALNPLSMAQLVALYNKTKPEVLVASKFANKGAGVTKLWDRMQSIPYSTAPAERKARTPKEPKAPKAPSEPRTVGKAPAAEGKAIRAGTVTAAILARMLLGTDTLEQIAANANVPACAAGAKTETQSRIWGLWKNNGIGYSVDTDGHYVAVLPGNLTPDTAIKDAKAA